MIILEEWQSHSGSVRLVIDKRGDLVGQWCGPITGGWWNAFSYELDPIPLFGTTKTPRRPVATKSRRTRSRPASSPPLATARRAR